MAFLFFAILFGLAAAYGYFVDRHNEDFENRWICTGRSALAGSSFAMLFCFVLWLIFKHAETTLKASKAGEVPAVIAEGMEEEREEPEIPELPDAAAGKVYAVRSELSLENPYPGLGERVVGERLLSGDAVRYRFLVEGRGWVTALGKEVSFSRIRDKAVETAYWHVDHPFWGGERLVMDSVRYELPLEGEWIPLVPTDEWPRMLPKLR